ncbi:MAG: hypothetical protein MUP41_19350 [Desulfobacterales bacterium]|nr:hypothetical protein [Desulfobacterales bacterium]
MKKRINWLLMGVSLLVTVCWVGPVAAQVSLELLNPRGEIKPPPTFAPTPRVTDLAGKRIGIYWNGKSGGNNFWDVAEEVLKEKFPTATILRYKGPFDLGEKVAGTLAKEVDIFIYGVGD